MSEEDPKNQAEGEGEEALEQVEAVELSLEDQLDKLLVSIDKVEPGVLQAAGVEVPEGSDKEDDGFKEAEVVEEVEKEASDEAEVADDTQEEVEEEAPELAAAVEQGVDAAGESEDVQQVEEPISSDFEEAVVAEGESGSDDVDLSFESLEQALDKMIELPVDDQQVEAASGEDSSEGQVEVSSVESIANEIVQEEQLSESNENLLDVLAELATDEDDEELVSQLDELLSETVASSEQGGVIDQGAIEQAASSEAVVESSVDEELVGEAALEPVEALEPAAVDVGGDEDVSEVVTDEESVDEDFIAGDMLSPEEVAEQQMLAEMSQASAAQVTADESVAEVQGVSAAGESDAVGDEEGIEQTVVDIDALLAEEADDAISGDFETTQEVAAAELESSGAALSDSSDVPSKPVKKPKPPLVAPAVKKAEKDEGADGEAVGKELDEQPELVAAAESSSGGETVADVPSITGQAVAVEGEKRKGVWKLLSWFSVLMSIIERICMFIDRLSLSRFPSGVRDMVGYAAMITIFNAMVLFLYVIFIK